MNIHIVNKENRPLARDKWPRAWARKVEGAPSIYRARNWPYKGRRTLVKVYPTFPQSHQEPIEFIPLPASEASLSFPPQLS